MRVRTQSERLAPAARKRALSVPVLGSRSALMAIVCSSVWQSQGSPFGAAETVTELGDLAGGPVAFRQSGDQSGYH